MPRVNNEDPLAYRASSNEPSVRPSPWTNAGLHRRSANPSRASETHPTSWRKKRTGAAVDKTRSLDAAVFLRRPIQRHDGQSSRYRNRPRRVRPRAARGMTRLRSTSNSAYDKITMPTGSAIHRIEQAYRGAAWVSRRWRGGKGGGLVARRLTGGGDDGGAACSQWMRRGDVAALVDRGRGPRDLGDRDHRSRRGPRGDRADSRRTLDRTRRREHLLLNEEWAPRDSNPEPAD